MLRWIVVAIVALAVTGQAAAQTPIRVGKAQAADFDFIVADVGAESGIFKKHGLDVEISYFAGDARQAQALAAGSIDIAVGGGPAIAFIAKGTPMLAVGAVADAPGTMMLVVLKDGPIKSEDDLKGRTISVSTAGSLTYWLAQNLSRSHGWGADGIKIAPLGSGSAQAAALSTHQIDGSVTESSTAFRLEEEGIGRILVRFGERLKVFHVHVIFASAAIIDKNPDAVRAFLAGWYETVRYMGEHRQQTIEIVARVSQVSTAIATRNYDELTPRLNTTGRFDPNAMDVLGRSFVELNVLPAAPDMTRLYSEAFLPKR